MNNMFIFLSEHLYTSLPANGKFAKIRMLYQGAPCLTLKMHPEMGLELPFRLAHKFGPYNLYFHNFFTELPLPNHLQKLNVKATSTVCENRLEHCQIQKPWIKKSKDEPYHQMFTEIIATEWHENSIVIIASN